jgi:hypothetical protein
VSAVPADRDHPGGDAGRDADLDAAFAEIVAGWDDETTDPVPRWPASEDTASEDTASDAGSDPTPDAGAPPPRGGTGLRDEPSSSMEQIRFVRDHGLPTPDPSPAPPPPGPRDWELAAAQDDHYEPPEPPPIPRGDLTSQLAWAGVLLGPVFLLFAGLFWRDVSRLWLALATVAFIAGFVVLVMRLPQSRDEDDDGAVV